jgi:hypothetical protein
MTSRPTPRQTTADGAIQVGGHGASDGQPGHAGCGHGWRAAALLPVAELVLGPEHPITMRARNYLAHWTRMAGGGPGSGLK